MSNSLVYTSLADSFEDHGNIQGDLHDAMSANSSILDENGIKVTKNGNVYAEREPERQTQSPEEIIYSNFTVKVYAEGVSGKDKPQPISQREALVPVKRIRKNVTLPNQLPKSNSVFDRACVRAKQGIFSPTFKSGDPCPFSGTLSMIWYSVMGISRRTKSPIDVESLNDALRMVKKVVPELSGSNYSLYKYIMDKVKSVKDLQESIDCLKKDFTLTAEELHDLQDFTKDSEVSLSEVSRSLGKKPEELVSCDLEGNVIGGQGAFLTDQKRWSDGNDDGCNGELYADIYSPRALRDKLYDQASEDAFNRIRTGAGDPDYQIIFDSKKCIKKPVGREFSHKVPTYTISLSPKGLEPTHENTLQYSLHGYWNDINREVLSQFPRNNWNINVIRGDNKVFISTFQPVSRRPSWHLACAEPKCSYLTYSFSSDDHERLNNYAKLFATPDHWRVNSEETYGDLKAEIEATIGQSLESCLILASKKQKCSCGSSMMIVFPTSVFKDKKTGANVQVPVMTTVLDHAWWSRPTVNNDWDHLIKLYRGDKRQAAEAYNTVNTFDGVKYAEQVGNTTYTWDLDWLARDDQADVRIESQQMENSDLLNKEIFDDYLNTFDTFTKKQSRYLKSKLYYTRASQSWAAIESSKFVSLLRKRMHSATVESFYPTYSMIARSLMGNHKLSYPEVSYAWSLLNSMKREFLLDAERYLALNPKEKELCSKWINYLKQCNFSQFKLVQSRIGSINISRNSLFLITFHMKAAYKRLSEIAKNSDWITAQENYLYSVEAGDIKSDEEIIANIKSSMSFNYELSYLNDLIGVSSAHSTVEACND